MEGNGVNLSDLSDEAIIICVLRTAVEYNVDEKIVKKIIYGVFNILNNSGIKMQMGANSMPVYAQTIKIVSDALNMTSLDVANIVATFVREVNKKGEVAC